MITQKWEGYVTSVDRLAGEFIATIRDLTDPTMSDESCAFKISDVRPENLQDTLEERMVFNWTIEVDDQGHSKSTMVFSENTWTAEDIKRLYEEARRRAEDLDLPIPPMPPSI